MAVRAMVGAFKPWHEQTQVSASVLLWRPVWWFPVKPASLPDVRDERYFLDHSDRFESMSCGHEWPQADELDAERVVKEAYVLAGGDIKSNEASDGLKVQTAALDEQVQKART
jgi:hypothetical protein